jgi:putative inorganic carbon (HCO3(-)) transporter
MSEYRLLPKWSIIPFKILLLFFISAISFILSHFVIFSNSLPSITVPLLSITLLICIFRFEWGILLLTFLIPLLTLVPSQLGVPNFSLVEMVFLILVIVWFAKLIKKKEVRFIKTPLDFPLFIFFLIIISSLIVTLSSFRYLPGRIIFYNLIEALKNIFIWNQEDRFFTLRGALILVEGILLYFLIVNNVKTKAMARKIITTVVVSSSAVGAYGIFQYLTGFQLLEQWVRETPYLTRINSAMADVNSLGAYLSLLLPLIILLIVVTEERKKKYLLTVLAPVLFFCLIFTNSRSSWVGFFGALVLLMIITYRDKLYLLYNNRFIRINFKKILWVGLSLLLASIAILVLIARSYNIESKKTVDSPMNLVFFTLNPNNMLDTVTTGRIKTYWRSGTEMIKDHPLFGVGIGSFAIHFTDYKDKLKNASHPENAHNYFLQIGAELGVVGLVVFLYLIVIIFRTAFIGLKKTNERYWKFILLGILSGIFGFLLTCLAQHPLLLIEIQFIFWLFVSLIFMVTDLKKIQRFRFSTLLKKSYIIIALAIIASIPLRIFYISGAKLITDQGFYPLERWENKFPFRWTKRTASQKIEIKGKTLYLPIFSYQPDIYNKPIKLNIYFDGHKIDSIILNESGWDIFNYPILPSYKKELTVSLIVSSTWNPLRAGFNKDSRNIGVGVGDISWDSIPLYFKSQNLEEEYGFYGWEIFKNGFKFRWSKKKSYISLIPKGDTLFIPIMCNKPDIDKNPQRVKFYIDNILIKETIIHNNNWRYLTLNLPEQNKKIWITLEVEKTWKPSNFGLSPDRRELGIAVGPISWRIDKNEPLDQNKR